MAQGGHANDGDAGGTSAVAASELMVLTRYACEVQLEFAARVSLRRKLIFPSNHSPAQYPVSGIAWQAQSGSLVPIPAFSQRAAFVCRTQRAQPYFSFIQRIPPARTIVIAFATISGASPESRPYTSQSRMPSTMTRNIPSEMSSVERVFQTFTNCGA